jgi:hypothetical protein
VLGLTACVVLGVPLEISPAIATARALDTAHAATALARLAPTLAAICGFAIAAGLVCVYVWHPAGVGRKSWRAA